MSEHEVAGLAELDRIGRRAGAALRAAVGAPAAGSDGGGAVVAGDAGGESPAPAASPPQRQSVPSAEPDVELALVGGRPLGRGPRDRATMKRRGGARRRRPALAAAALVVAVGTGVLVARAADQGPGVVVEGVGAPSGVGLHDSDDEGGVFPPDAAGSLLAVTGVNEDGSGTWQWTLGLPPAGQHLVFQLGKDSSTTAYVMPDIGNEPLQVATTDLDGRIDGGDVAVYGVVVADAAEGALGGAPGWSAGVAVEWDGADPVPLHVEAIEGATHAAFVGFVPPDVGADADVVARDTDGNELARVPLGWTGTTAAPEREGGIFPPDHDASTTIVGDENADGTYWDLLVSEGGRDLVFGVGGNEDSVETVLSAPASHPLQAIATLLDGRRPGVVAVYGLVDARAHTVELVRPGAEPVSLDVRAIEGATHAAFAGFVPEGVDGGALVVARDRDGNEVGRRPLSWTIHDIVGPEEPVDSG
jgi:hypothetical protein